MGMNQPLDDMFQAIVERAVRSATKPLEDRIARLEAGSSTSGMFKTMDAARELHISYNTLMSYVKRGMPFYAIEGTRYFDITEAQDWIKQQ